MFVAAIKKTDLVHFFRTYYRYQKASITTQEFLGMYLRSCDNEEFKEIIQSILTDQKLGSSLSDSLRKHTVFPPYVVQMIAVGEASSLLAPILEKIVFFLIQENDIEKKVEANVRQGIIMLVILLIGAFVTLIFVIPKIGEVLLTVRPELPLFTALVVKFSTFLQNNIAFLGIGLVILLLIFAYIRRTRPEKIDMWHLRIPIFGPILRSQIHGYFFSVVSICTMMKDITVRKAIKYAARTINHIPAQQTLFEAVHYMKAEGLPSYEAIKRADVNKIFDNELYVMMEAGEKSDSLSEIFEEEAKEYQKILVRQAEEMGDKLSSTIIIPSIIILVLLLMSVYYPIFELVSSAQGMR